MSLARAFTNRRNKSDTGPMLNIHLGRAASQRAGKPVRRNDISGPVALVSTTNMLSYDAPNIAGTAPISVRTDLSSSANDSSSSGDESDMSVLSNSTNETVTDNSSIEISPISSQPEPNHLSCYFNPAIDTATPDRSLTTSPAMSPDAPSIPKRVPSHSKKAHEHIHRKRAIQRMMSPPASISSSSEIFSTPEQSPFVGVPRENPFGSELQQLEEVAEGYSAVVQSTEIDPEIAYLQSKNLAHVSASEYLAEIESLIYAHLIDEPVWI